MRTQHPPGQQIPASTTYPLCQPLPVYSSLPPPPSSKALTNGEPRTCSGVITYCCLSTCPVNLLLFRLNLKTFTTTTTTKTHRYFVRPNTHKRVSRTPAHPSAISRTSRHHFDPRHATSSKDTPATPESQRETTLARQGPKKGYPSPSRCPRRRHNSHYLPPPDAGACARAQAQHGGP